MLGKDLFKHVPTGNGFCIHRAVPIWGVWWCYRGTLYHVQATKATPSSGPLPDFISFCLSPQPSARTEAKMQIPSMLPLLSSPFCTFFSLLSSFFKDCATEGILGLPRFL